MKNRKWIRIVVVIALAAVAYGVRELVPARDATVTPPASSSSPPAVTAGGPGTAGTATRSVIEQAFADRRSDLDVEVAGRVDRLLPDDREGSRHQKFILALPSGHTVLVSHNIDLAPRVPCVVGDSLVVRGEYEWSERGGVVHWTHHDPAGRREGGWIEHDGRRYE